MSIINPRPRTATASKSKHKNNHLQKDEMSTSDDNMSVNILEILHQDHLRVLDLFFQYKLVEDSKEKKRIVEEILKELHIHTMIEEELVYPASRENAQDKETECILDEAYTEHHVAKVVMAELTSMKPSDELYDAKVSVLHELVRHHIHEEEKEMFKKLREANIDLEQLGEEVLNRKTKLENQSWTGGITKIWKELKDFKAS